MRNSLPWRLAVADILAVTTTIKEAEGSLRELTARRDALLEELARIDKEITILARRNVPPRFIDREEARAISDRIFEKHAELFRELAAC